MTLLDDSVTQALLASRITGARGSYQKDNPIESAAVIAYLKGGTRPTTFSTAMGKHLVYLADARRAVVTPTPSTVAFGSRPQVGPINSYYVGDVTLDNKTIVGTLGDWNGPESGRGLSIGGSHNTVITNCDFVGPSTGIYMDDCSGTLTIKNCRFRDVGWNAIQINHSVFTGGRVSDIKVKGGRNEDGFSFVGGSGGASATDPLFFERIYMEGDPAKCRPSGSGFMFEQAQHLIFRNFTLLNPGQVGFGIHPGIDIHVTDGIIYSQAYKAAALGDTGADLGDPAITTASLTEVARIQSKWYAINGSENSVWAPQSANIIGWNTCNWGATIDPTTLAVVL